MLLTYKHISSILSKFSSCPLIDTAEFSENTCMEKLSDSKMVKCTATKFITKKDLSCSYDVSSKRRYALGILELDFVFQTGLLLLNKLMQDSSDIFPDLFSISSIKDYQSGIELSPGDTLKTTISILELSSSSATLEALTETDNGKSSRCQFSIDFSQEIERSLCIVKPDAVKAGLKEMILETMQVNEIKISNISIGRNTVIMGKYRRFTEKDCRELYAEHVEKPFYKEIETFMTSDYSFVCCVEGPRIDSVGCIQRYRALMGDTDPSKALSGTIRSFAGSSKGENAVHGSDSLASAHREIPIFFPEIRFWSAISD